MKSKTYKVIGLMSGTSRDGLDIAFCNFWNDGSWRYTIEVAETIHYPKNIHKLLDDAYLGNNLESDDNEYGRYIGEQTNSFCKRHNIDIDFIASHGHTIFHQPEKRITLQIGSGKIISEICRKSVVCDFRSQDVELGGQGAPLVPIGDELLFNDYDACINIGGFSNISFKTKSNDKNQRVAFDICPANIVLNELTKKIGKEYDKDGKIARRSDIVANLLNELNDLEYYKTSHPKSLGKEYVDSFIKPILTKYKSSSIENIISTYTEHIAIQISKHISNIGRVLITGGGAFNKYLIDRIGHHSQNKNIIIPDDILVNYKEAMIFAFMGVLRMRGEINVLSSVTGAKENHCSGKLTTHN